MQLAEALARTSNEQLFKIAESVGLESGANRRALEHEAAASLTDGARLGRLLADLSDEEWAALKVVFFNGGDQGITVELCHQIVNLLSGRRRKTSAKAVEDLQNRGLIYLRALNYRQMFFIPTDLLAVLTNLMNRQLIARVHLPDHAVLRPTLPERDLLEDLYRFLAYLYKNQVTLTQQGQIFKRHLRALLDLLGNGTDDDESLVGRYPEPLGLLVGYTMDRRLIVREDGRLVPARDLTDWVAGPTGAKRLDLYRYWQDRYFYQDLQTFLSVMRSVGHQWVSLSRLVAELEPLINPSQRGSFMLRVKHHVSTFLAPLALLEMAEAGTPEEPDLACRLTPAGEAVLGEQEPAREPDMPEPIVQATFEIIAPRPVAPLLLWHLELMADLVGRTDRTLTYRLSRQSVYRALKAGMSGEELTTFLRERSATGLPQNVAFDLAAWASSYGQVYLQAVTLLRCADPILAQQIKASRRTSRFVLGELGPTDLMVDGNQARELLEALEADGLMPRPDVVKLGS